MSAGTRLAWLAGFLAALVALFSPTYVSIVSIWARSDTFAHGFLVVPIVLFLIWRKRAVLSELSYRADWRALPAVAAAGLLWLLARLTEVLVIEQLAAVAMIPLLIWLVLGLGAVRVMAFPLGFIFFAVPMGEWLVYPLMQFTAYFTVSLLRLTGIPVYWEGTFFSIPSGDWSVVAACSGIRYLIASVFLGVLYAYLSYHRFWRRAVFVLLSILVPILANGIRAYLIVMIAHLSDMRFAVGIDHLIYGWVFFGIVMFVLFAVGNLWSDRQGQAAAAEPLSVSSSIPMRSTAQESGVLIVGVLLVLLWPGLSRVIDMHTANARAPHALEMPVGSASWLRIEGTMTDWSPRYLGAYDTQRQRYSNGEGEVGVYLALYGYGTGELVNSQNVLVAQQDSRWRNLARSTHSLSIAGNNLGLAESRLVAPDQTLLVWSWYWIDGHQTVQPYVAKLYELAARFLGRRPNEAALFLYTEMGDDARRARERLRRFATDMLPSFNGALEAMGRPQAAEAGSAPVSTW